MFEAKLTITAPGLEAALNNLAAAIAGAKAAAPTLNQMPTQAPANPTQAATGAAPAPTPVPQASPLPQAGLPLGGPPQYTVDQIMQAGATLMDAGKVTELTNLLHSFGVQAVMDLKPEQLGAFATEMRKMGAAI